ncbi:polyprenyl synthetase family protein [Flavobacteriaceae bacterium]|nr:polyprenyl synthetase family protein [Flavobacteriaceae bacterium]MDC1279499.1 polyprenyl synthetase family protein [Flavobacteriaceae bacterium]MDC1336488.1 polyprenyl synthetase family protein [Flavobacteriaceae bacterium]
MDNIKFYADLIDKELSELTFSNSPKSLYDPIDYILKIGGKRIRPYLVLLAAESFGGDYKKALGAALSVECFHNFTLMHDDIMDSANLRRGNETVHLKWDTNQSILSGDALLIYSYNLLQVYEPTIYKKLNNVLNNVALQVCEGQQLDLDFEYKSDVSFEDYINMIELKTAVLVGAALKMGAIISEANDKDLINIYKFGVNLGIAFQLQDDYLDTFGNEELVGKSIGGDIIENKKTALFHLSLLNANKQQANDLIALFNNSSSENKVINTTKIFKETKADIKTLELVEDYTNLALQSINRLSISNESKQIFIDFSNSLLERKL